MAQTVEEILNELLAIFENQLPAADRSQGSMIYAKCAALASAIWGLNRHQEWISRQRLPSTADTPFEWGAEFGLVPNPAETPDAFLQRLHERLRNPPAGGTPADYRTWAKEVAGVKDAWVHEGEAVGGVGVVQVTILAEIEEDEVSEDLLTAVYDHIMSKRAVGLYLLRVIGARRSLVPVDLTGGGPNWNPTACLAEITAYMAALPPDTPLYRSQLLAIAVANGADNPTLHNPETDGPAHGPSSGEPDLPIFYRLNPNSSSVT